MHSIPSQPLARRSLAILAALVALAIIARALPGPRTIDDAFITFRYSRNLVEGEGFVYNPGVRTLGTTTPLFTVLMAAISAITGGQEFPWYAIAVSAVADAGTCVLLFLIARRLTGSEWLGALLGALWAVSPRSVTFAVGGMETSLTIFWMVGAVWWYITGRERWMGVFAALGLLTRIDSALWVAPLFLYQLIERLRAPRDGSLLARLPWRTWILCAVVLLPWLVFSLVYFGSPLPNSVAAKTAAYVLSPGAALSTFITAYATPFFEFDTFGAVGAMVAAVVYFALSLFGIAFAARRLPRLLPFLIYPWLYFVVFSLANPLIFRWYLVPPLPALMLGISAGAWSLLSALERAPRLRPASALVMAAIGVVWLGTSLNAWTLHPTHGADRPAPEMAWHEIELLYEQIGTELRDEHGVTPQVRVGSADIGAVGYFSRATIVDTVGLVTPELSRYYPVPSDLIAPDQNYAIPPRLILDTQPAYLVTMEGFVRQGLEQNAEFRADYELIEEIPTGFYGTGMRLYRRRERAS